MKIGNSPEGSVAPAKAEQRSGARKPEAAGTTEGARPAASAPTPSTQVAISSAAKLAASSGTAGTEDGSFDAAKVQRIAQAITEGKFTINAQAIADKLVSNAQELLDSRANKH